MSTLTIRDGDLITKDPSDVKAYTMDWDSANLGTNVSITISSWTVTAIWPSTTDTSLTIDQEFVLTVGGLLRNTLCRLTGGTIGQHYQIANKIVTDESPSQTKERSFFVVVEQR